MQLIEFWPPGAASDNNVDIDFFRKLISSKQFMKSIPVSTVVDKILMFKKNLLANFVEHI